MPRDLVDGVAGVLSFGLLFDIVLNSAELLTILADVLLTPMILFGFTILPNIDTSAMPWVQDVFVAVIVVLGVVYLLDAIGRAIDRYRQANDN